MVEGLKSRKGTLGSVIVKHKKKKVHCPLGKGYTIDDAKKLWKKRKKLIGKTATVQYQNITEDNSLFLPKLTAIRDDK